MYFYENENKNKINRKAYFVLSPLIYLIMDNDDTGNKDCIAI